jgi:hypothetical protein
VVNITPVVTGRLKTDSAWASVVLFEIGGLVAGGFGKVDKAKAFLVDRVCW